MPRVISELHDINVGDYVEDCNYQPGIVIEKYDILDTPDYGTVCIQSYVYGGASGYCSVKHCGLRILTEDEVMQWLISGPSDIDIPQINWWRRRSIFEIEPPKLPVRFPRTPKHTKKYQQRRYDTRRR